MTSKRDSTPVNVIDASMQSSFWLVDPASLQIIDVGAALATRLMHSPARIRTMSLDDFVPAEGISGMRYTIAQTHHEISDTEILQLRCASGELWPVRIVWRAQSKSGETVLLGIVQDATREFALQRQNASLQCLLREQEANLRLAQQMLNIGIWKMEISSGHLIWSENTYQIYGVSPENFTPNFESYVALVHPNDRIDMLERYENFQNSEAPQFSFTHRICQSNGEVVYVHGVAERGEGEEIGWLIGVVQDITKDVIAGERMLEANRMQRIAGRVAQIGGWRVDLDPLKIIWSSETCTIHGEPEGTSPTLDRALEYYLPEYRERIGEALAACSQSGLPFDEIAQLSKSDGTPIWVRAIGEPVHDEFGAIIAVQGAFQDISDIRAVQDQSLALERRLEQTLENISDGFFILDREWRFIFVNSQAEIILRRSGENLIGNLIWDAFPEVAGSRFQTQYEAAVRDKIVARFQDYYEPLSSWFDVSAYPTPEGLAVYFRDVTLQREREIQLRLLETAVSRQNDMLVITEAEPLDAPDGPKIVYVNDAFVARTGFNRADVIGKTPRLLQGPKTQRTELDRIRRAMESWSSVRAALINYTKAGEEFWVELDLVPIADEKGRYTHWVSIERDVTERKIAEEAVKRSDDRFRLVAKATNDVIWDWDLIANTVWWNENVKSLFGYDPDDLEPGPESWSNRIHPDDIDRVTKRCDEAISGSSSTWGDEYRFLHADGHAITTVDRAFIIRNAEGKPIRMLGSMIDVTSTRETESRLRQSQKLEAVGQLTGGVAHDFNNLLTVILGNAEILSAEISDESLRHLAEMTATAAERGSELTSRLLAFSRKQPLQPKMLDLASVIQGMGGLLRRTLAEDISIDISSVGGLWKTEVDQSQLESAILNLAVNARDAMPRGGCLSIEASNVMLKKEDLAPDQDVTAGQYVLVTVTDTGSGIPSDALTRIFEPFFTTKDIGKGSGLGLSMVYGFVKQSGGHVSVQTEIDAGTTFKLYFPRAHGQHREGSLTRTQTRLAGGSETILVVEDDTLVREYLVAQLKGLGYQVISASCGPDVLKDLPELPHIDLLFTDVIMPGGMTGRDLAEIIRESRPDIKVLFTSGHTDDAIVHHGRLDAGLELLSKPYRREQMAAKVRQLLDTE